MMPACPNSSRLLAAFMAAMVAIAFASATIPAQAQTYTDLHDYNPSAGDPATLFDSGLIPQGRDGEFYGTSQYGGTSNEGTVFKVSPAGTPTILANLDSTDGEYPTCGLTFGTDGNFYGATPQGGTSNVGIVFKITPSGTLTVLHNFTNNGDGGTPTCPPVQASNGNFYGVTTGDISGVQGVSTFYEVTSAGTFSTLHIFATSEGQHCSGITQGTDGNFYGACLLGGLNSMGTLYKISSAGKVTVLHNLDGTDGNNEQGAFLVQAKDGNFYGVGYNGGADGYGVIFRLKPSGTYTVLHNFTGGSDGGNPNADFTLGTDGNLYSTTSVGGSGHGVIFRLTTAGVFTVLYNFDGTHGSNPQSNLTLSTDGLFYGETENGGAHGDGVFFSFDVGLKPFISIYPTSGKAGTQVGIMGQDFDSASVVRFGGVPATKVTLTGTTYITATVPAGAVDGYVTVTTGATTLTSTKTFTVHDSWSIGTAVPTARMGAFVGAVGSNIYVISGLTPGGFVNVNEIYNTPTNKWTTGTPDPNPRWAGASAVVNGILYLIGGSNGSFVNLVEAYNPATKAWSTKAPMPTIRQGASAVVDKNIIYVIGGQNTSGYLATVESYNTTTDTWTEETPLSIAKAFAAVGLLGTTVVAADGADSSAYLGDNEGYNVSLNEWTALTADPTPRGVGCFAAIGGQLYVAGGNGTKGTIGLNEAYNSTKKSWATLTPMPDAVDFPGSASVGGRVFCFGGGVYPTAAYNYVQIYQP